MAEPSGARLVGREGPLRLLQDALVRAAAGRPSAVVVSGELGVGKTRLVREFLAGADAEVFAGACVPVLGEPLPYAALTQALRRSGTGVVRQALARSPELARLMPGDGSPAESVEDPGAAGSRLRLFQSVLGLLGQLGAGRPVVHVVEDVQWADPSTLDLLAFLAANLNDERVLVLLTLRDDTPDDPRVLSWLAEFGRLWPVERVALERLDRAETAALVAELRGEVATEAVVDDVVARSAGNPLFVEQLALAAGEGSPLPSTLHGLLSGRFAHLPEESRRVLGATALIGRAATLPLLARTLDVEPLALEAALRPALTSHVLEVGADLRVDFQHPAFREVVEADLLPGERLRLHLAAAQALEGEVDRDPTIIGEVARHWLVVGDAEKALAASQRAGAAYAGMYAFGAAHRAYATVLDLADRVPHHVDVVETTLLAADAADLAGEAAAALDLLARLDSGAVSDGVRAGALTRVGSIQFRKGDGEAADRAYQDALALVPTGETSVLAARLQAGIALLAVGWSRLGEAEDAAVEALRVARAVGARREEGVALNALGCVTAMRGRLDEGIAAVTESLAIARELEDPQSLGTAYINLSHVLGLAGRVDEALELSRVGIVDLTRVGQQRQQGSLLLHNVSELLVEAGRYAEARELLDQALARHPRGINAAAVLRLSASIAMVTGDLSTAWERCEQARLTIEAENAPAAWLRDVLETAAEIELWSGRPDAAYQVVLDGLDLVAGTDEEAFAIPLVALGLRALADSAAVHRDHRSRTRRVAQRSALVTELDGVTSRPDAAGRPLATALGQWARAELARLDQQDSADVWAAAAEAWADLGRPFRAAYSRWREAEGRLSHGVSAASLGALRSAHAAAVALGAQRLVEEVETLATWYRADLLPAHVEVTETDPLAAYALTEREREVLAALAAGHTNREIADAMFISVKTASVHVSNILRKLDVSGRQEAARIAHRLGVGAEAAERPPRASTRGM